MNHDKPISLSHTIKHSNTVQNNMIKLKENHFNANK